MSHTHFAMKEFKSVFMLTFVGDSTLSAVVLFGHPVSGIKKAAEPVRRPGPDPFQLSVVITSPRQRRNSK